MLARRLFRRNRNIRRKLSTLFSRTAPTILATLRTTELTNIRFDDNVNPTGDRRRIRIKSYGEAYEMSFKGKAHRTPQGTNMCNVMK